MAKITPGAYVACAKGFDFGWTKNHSEQVAVCLEIVGGDWDGAELTWWGYFTEKTQARTLEALRYMGWQGDDLEAMTGLGSIQCQIVVEDELGQDGKTYPRIRWVNRLGGGGRVKLAQPMDADERRRFAATMRSHAAAVPAVKGIPAPAARTNTAATSADGTPGGPSDQRSTGGP